jgi:ABC-type branched-subunit amino acid transport system permease subunit
VTRQTGWLRSKVLPEIPAAARETLDGIETRVGFYRFLDLSLDGLSLASIYFLAAIGLAITFGVMGVINMAHGEFIMIGAYTGYVVQHASSPTTPRRSIARCRWPSP